MVRPLSIARLRGSTSGGAAAAPSSPARGSADCWVAAWLGLLAADVPLVGGAAGMRPAALSAEASPRTDLLRRTVPGRLRPWSSLRSGGESWWQGLSGGRGREGGVVASQERSKNIGMPRPMFILSELRHLRTELKLPDPKVLLGPESWLPMPSDGAPSSSWAARPVGEPAIDASSAQPLIVDGDDGRGWFAVRRERGVSWVDATCNRRD